MLLTQPGPFRFALLHLDNVAAREHNLYVHARVGPQRARSLQERKAKAQQRKRVRRVGTHALILFPDKSCCYDEYESGTFLPHLYTHEKFVALRRLLSVASRTSGCLCR